MIFFIEDNYMNIDIIIYKFCKYELGLYSFHPYYELNSKTGRALQSWLATSLREDN